jgi:hypothetical protein
MKSLFTIPVLVLLMALTCQSQTTGRWEKWQWLTGTWKGEGSGQPGQGEGFFTFSYDLDQNIMVRKSHSEYDSPGKISKSVHEDLMIVYPSTVNKSLKAIYFDNEGHVIDYQVSYSDSSIVFTSPKTGNMPIFRLTYTPLETNTVDTKFEMSQDGVNFTTYIEGKSRK